MKRGLRILVSHDFPRVSHYNLQVFRFETCRSRSPSLKVAQVVNMTFVNFPPSQRSGCHHVARLGSDVANVSPDNPVVSP